MGYLHLIVVMVFVVGCKFPPPCEDDPAAWCGGPDAAPEADAAPEPSCEARIAYSRLDGLYALRPGETGTLTLASGFHELHPVWSPDGTQIVFSRRMDAPDGSWTTDLFRVDADGSQPVNLTNIEGADTGAVWSPDGTRIAFSSSRDDGTADADLYVMAASGANPTRIAAKADAGVSWSPDGRRLAYASYTSGDFQIWTSDPDGGNAIRVNPNAFSDMTPLWSPDGTRIAFSSLRGCGHGCGSSGPALWVMGVDGAQPRNLTPDAESVVHASWSPDGTRLAFEGVTDDERDVFVVEVATGEITNLTAGPGVESEPTWSPDGQAIAFVSNRDGNDELYRIHIDGTGLERLTTTEVHHEHEPQWSRCP